MSGVISFHPIDVRFYDELVQPLLAGEKCNPESWIERAQRREISAWYVAQTVDIIEHLMDQIEPPPAPEGSTLWVRVRTRLERFDHRPPRGSVLLARHIDPELHLYGRPFLIAEQSAEKVADVIDEFLEAEGPETAQSLIVQQLMRLDPELPRHMGEPSQAPATNASRYRTELLKQLRQLFDLAQAARSGDSFGRLGGERRPARDVLRDELPWMTLVLHARANPYWIARDVDGLAGICSVAGLDVPVALSPPWPLFGEAMLDFTELEAALDGDLSHPNRIGLWVAPDDVGELLAFVNAKGSQIIKIAGEFGEGARIASVLRKIRECLRYAELKGLGYLEGSGLPVPEG